MKRPVPASDESFVLLRFSDGTIIDPRQCPRRIHSREHWEPTGEIDQFTGANASCSCGDAS